ncbi:Uracil-DNA glycosylase family 1 [Trinorchestia longiramus]|nr:Uracil-DNA glycosylase family 1 [Trinorchestia longiramus]
MPPPIQNAAHWEISAVIRFLSAKGVQAAEIHRQISEVYGESISSTVPACKKAKDTTFEDAGISGAENVAPDHKLSEEIVQLSKEVSALHRSIGQSWYSALRDEFSKPYFKKLSNFLAAERKAHTVYPREKDVFSWTQYCHVDDVKVVILGQDPYHGPNQAHGLCFSVMPTVPPPPSLKNMYKELARDIEGFKEPGHGYLVGWAKQGVLLLNAVLTVRASSANSHKDRGWEKFTSAVISAVAKQNKGVVFLLWGAYAQKKVAHINKVTLVFLILSGSYQTDAGILNLNT